MAAADGQGRAEVIRAGMIQRLYVHNFRCLENFKLLLGQFPSVLLLGRNGSGKTTVALALEILQRIARGTNRVGDLVRPRDLTLGRAQVPVRFEIEVLLEGRRRLLTMFQTILKTGSFLLGTMSESEALRRSGLGRCLPRC